MAHKDPKASYKEKAASGHYKMPIKKVKKKAVAKKNNKPGY